MVHKSHLGGQNISLEEALRIARKNSLAGKTLKIQQKLPINITIIKKILLDSLKTKLSLGYSKSLKNFV